MDLNHCLAFTKPITIKVSTYEECSDADLIIMTAGPSIQPGGTRLDLAKQNSQIMKKIVKYTRKALILSQQIPLMKKNYFVMFEMQVIISSIEKSQLTTVIKRISEAILRNKHSILTVSSMQLGACGIDGIAMSVPTIVSSDGIHKIVELKLSDSELMLLKESEKNYNLS